MSIVRYDPFRDLRSLQEEVNRLFTGNMARSFDEEGIAFSTPWTGVKRERWEDLESAELNDWCSWYTLKFKSGKTIRLSRYLSGHLSALELAAERLSSQESAEREF